jgi:hypothetical protein
MKHSELHSQAAQCCLRIELINQTLKIADNYNYLSFLKELKEKEIKKYAEIMDDIVAPLNLV